MSLILTYYSHNWSCTRHTLSPDLSPPSLSLSVSNQWRPVRLLWRARWRSSRRHWRTTGLFPLQSTPCFDKIHQSPATYRHWKHNRECINRAFAVRYACMGQCNLNIVFSFGTRGAIHWPHPPRLRTYSERESNRSLVQERCDTQRRLYWFARSRISPAPRCLRRSISCASASSCSIRGLGGYQRLRRNGQWPTIEESHIPSWRDICALCKKCYI